MVVCYNYNRSTGNNDEVKDFEPNDKNWLVKAEKEDTVIYFQSLAAYNRWAGTTCGISSHFINIRKKYKGYKLTSNL